MAWNRSSGYCATQSQKEAETVSVQVKVPIGQNKVTICDKNKANSCGKATNCGKTKSKSQDVANQNL